MQKKKGGDVTQPRSPKTREGQQGEVVKNRAWKITAAREIRPQRTSTRTELKGPKLGQAWRGNMADIGAKGGGGKKNQEQTGKVGGDGGVVGGVWGWGGGGGGGGGGLGGWGG